MGEEAQEAQEAKAGEAEAQPNLRRLLRLDPCFFFQRKEFEGERALVQPEPEWPGRYEIHSDSIEIENLLRSELDMVVFQRHGILRGEYVVHPGGTVLFNRRGDCIVANAASDHFRFAAMLGDMVSRIDEDRDTALQLWDHFHVDRGSAVMSSAYSRNYYHFTFDFAAAFSFLAAYGVQRVIMPTHCLMKTFQTDLVSRVTGAMRLVPMQVPRRVIDPVLVQSLSSATTLDWLRKATGYAARPGSRRLYIVREEEGRVAIGNNLSEGPEIAALLAEFGFERVNFGQGQYTVAQQVAMLEGAGLVLAVSGANLTNLAYLSPPLVVIEVMPQHRFSALNMRTSARLGFTHHTVVSGHFDTANNVYVDAGLLRRIIESA